MSLIGTRSMSKEWLPLSSHKLLQEITSYITNYSTWENKASLAHSVVDLAGLYQQHMHQQAIVIHCMLSSYVQELLGHFINLESLATTRGWSSQTKYAFLHVILLNTSYSLRLHCIPIWLNKLITMINFKLVAFLCLREFHQIQSEKVL